MKKPVVVNSVLAMFRRVRPVNPCHMVPVINLVKK